MKVKTVMVRDVVSCTPDAAAASAAWLMYTHDCGFLPVVDGATHRLLGVITDRDVCMAGAFDGRPLSGVPVRCAMQAAPVACRPDETLREVHARMRDHQVRRVPVVDEEGRLAGVVTLNDLAREAFDRRGPAATRRQRDVARTLAAVCEPHERPEVDDPDGEDREEPDGEES